jgi:hypothetical protein
MRWQVLGAILVAGGAGAVGTAGLATYTVDLPVVREAPPGWSVDPPEGIQFPYQPYDGRFVFARIMYDMGWGYRGGRIGNGGVPWSHDYPEAERNFTQILRELTYVRPYTEDGNILALDDPRLFQFPIAYMSEPGYWNPTEEQVMGLRNYLLKGGFIIFDDFQGPDHMYNLVEQMRRVLPELELLPLDGSEAIFDSFFEIDITTLRLPLYGQGPDPQWYGIFEQNDKQKRMIAVAANYGDFGEYWEYSSNGFYPVDLSNEAYKVGVNYIVYAMTH